MASNFVLFTNATTFDMPDEIADPADPKICKKKRRSSRL